MKQKWFSVQRSKPCEGLNFQFVEGSIICHDYQEIKIQESTQVLGVGSIPRSIPIILKDDLVDIVKAGGTTSLSLFFAFVPIFFSLQGTKILIVSLTFPGVHVLNC